MAQYGLLANLKKPLVKVLYHTKATSVQHFKKLTQITYKMHLWMDKNIQPAPWYIKLFWLAEYSCGVLFSPNFNWAIYRALKRILHFIAHFFHLLKQIKATAVDRLNIQPAVASTSGQ